MTNLEHRINLLAKLGDYMTADAQSWRDAKDRAVQQNSWFTHEHIEIAAKNIVEGYLQHDLLTAWAAQYPLPVAPKIVGIVMAGNIPLVGFHDFLCGYICGHHLKLKLSSKDAALIRDVIRQLTEWEPATAEQVELSDVLTGCDAYIATGSNNSSRYFEQYFAKWPHIIRRNRTSVAVLDGTETEEELQALSKDVFTYFGLGCRNVTQVQVPEGYDFAPLLDAFKNHEALMNHHKYHNNYDYHLAVYLLNKVPYLNNDSLLMVENEIPFSAVSVLHYQHYNDRAVLMERLKSSEDVQAIVGHGAIPFGTAQMPALADYADGVDTMAFLTSL